MQLCRTKHHRFDHRERAVLTCRHTEERQQTAMQHDRYDAKAGGTLDRHTSVLFAFCSQIVHVCDKNVQGSSIR